MCGFSFHLKYEEIPKPRNGDKVVAEMFHEYSTDKKLLESLQRMRGSMNVLFLSDVVTADGKRIETEMIKLDKLCSIPTKYDFPPECPTESDERAWIDFWTCYCEDNFLLPFAYSLRKMDLTKSQSVGMVL